MIEAGLPMVDCTNGFCCNFFKTGPLVIFEIYFLLDVLVALWTRKRRIVFSENLIPWIASIIKKKFTLKFWLPGCHWNIKHLSFLETFVTRLAMLIFTICSPFEIFVAKVSVLKIKIFSVLKIKLMSFQSFRVFYNFIFLNLRFWFLGG